MVGFIRFLRVTVIFLEQSQRFPVIGADNDLSLFPIFGRASVGCEQVYVVLRVAYSHRSRFGFYPRVGGDSEGRLGLSETFHQFYTREP